MPLERAIHYPLQRALIGAFSSQVGGGSSYTPATTFLTTAGAWFYGWDNTDLKVNSDGTGGSVADGGTVGRWNDRSGYGNHISNSTANTRPVWKDAKVRCFWATNTTVRNAFLSNTATSSTFPKQNFSGGMIVDIPGASNPSAMIDFGTSQCTFVVGDSSSTNYRFVRTFNGATYQSGTKVYSSRKCIVTWRSNATNLIVNVDGVEDALTALAVENMTRLWINRFNGGSGKMMNFREIVAFASDVGAATIASLRDYLRLKAGTASIDTTRTVAVYGDSLSEGVGSETGKPWADYITNRSTSKWYSFSQDGSVLSAPCISAANLAALKGSAEGVAVVWIGTNDIISGGKTAAQCETNLWAYTDTLRAAGVKVVVCTLQDFATNRAIKDDFNTRIVANWASHADALVRLDTLLPDCTNATKFTSDQVHLMDSGYADVGGAIQTAMASI